jgi:hypothetical protein
LEKKLIHGLTYGDGDLQHYRSILHRFIAPAFTGAKA